VLSPISRFFPDKSLATFLILEEKTVRMHCDFIIYPSLIMLYLSAGTMICHRLLVKSPRYRIAFLGGCEIRGGGPKLILARRVRGGGGSGGGPQ